MARYHATLVSHTHWDRAWYVTFQEFRIRLVRLVDKLIDLLNADPNYRVYMLDGQMSVLEDYLEARPTQAAALQALCKAGRIQVGPWYVLADEFLVSPEALIRNLMVGHRMGKNYGGVVKIGYVPDGFGHIAQLPQIFRGFDIDNAFFWRGMGADGDRLGTEFEWCAPDGSSVTTILMPWGYHNVSNLGYAIHWGDTSQMQFDIEMALDKVDRAINKIKPMANTDALLLMNGIDHAEPEPHIPEIIGLANQSLEDAEVVQGTLFDHLNRVRAAGKEFKEFEGEFRWGRYSEILQGVYSARMHLKQSNHAGETLLERYTEPLTALAWLSGEPIPAGTPDLVWLAWHWLLLNHPHDDIYGSGIDEVHQEMDYRFSQSRQIGEALVRDSVRQIARQVDYRAQEGTPVMVFNPLGQARSEIAEGTIDFEFDDPKAGDFQLVNAQGKAIPHQVVSDQQEFWMEVFKANRKRRVTVLFPVDVPACGYTTVYAQKVNPHPPTPSPSGRGGERQELKAGSNGAENEYMSFRIAEDGSLTVTDKASGQTYDGLHVFTDVDDAGDEYTFCPADHSQTFSTAGGKAVITQVEQGPCRAAFRVEQTLLLPESLSEDEKCRSTKLIPMPIVSTICLYADQPGLYISTEIDNQARDHKLMVSFPTGLSPEQAHVDESFMVASRDLKLPSSEGWVEDPTSLMHQRTFTDLSDGECGFAILNRGLPSVEVSEDGVIGLTLLRCVGWLSRPWLTVRRIAAGPLVPTPGAQCIGKHRFEYAILPHAGDWQQVYRTAHAYDAPLLVRRADTHPGLELREMNVTRDNPDLVRPIPWPRGGHLPHDFSFIQIDSPQLVLSAVRRGENGLILRFYNITHEAVKGTLTSGLPLAAAYGTNMNEERRETLAVQDGRRVNIEVGGSQVVTVEVVPGEK